MQIFIETGNFLLFLAKWFFYASLQTRRRIGRGSSRPSTLSRTNPTYAPTESTASVALAKSLALAQL